MSPSPLKLTLILLALSSVLAALVPQLEFGVGGLFDGLTRGGLEGEKRNASPEPEPKPQLEFGVGGLFDGLTRGGLEGEK
jgi:hypothetical protein